MVMNIFLKLQGIDGESQHDKFAKWIDVMSYSWGVSNPGEIGPGGAGNARPETGGFNFMHAMSVASPVLFQKCAAGETIPEGELVAASDGAKGPERFLSIKFQNILVSSVQDSASSGGDNRPTESVSFAFGSIAIEYAPAGGESAKAGWDFEKNKPV